MRLELYRLAQVLVRFLLQVGFGFRVRGARRIPRAGGLILAANHQSWFDPILLGDACPRLLRYMARRTLFGWPLGPFIRLWGAYAIEREGDPREALRRTVELLERGEATVIFVEGTRTRDGRLQPVRAGAAMLAVRARATIVPVYIGGAFDAWPKGTYFPRLRRPIRVSFGRPLAVGAPPPGLTDREHYRLIQEAIQAELEALERERRGRRIISRSTPAAGGAAAATACRSASFSSSGAPASGSAGRGSS